MLNKLLLETIGTSDKQCTFMHNVHVLERFKYGSHGDHMKKESATLNQLIWIWDLCLRRNSAKATDWTFDDKETFEEVTKNEQRSLLLSKKSCFKCTDYLRYIKASTRGKGEVTMTYQCPHCHSLPVENYIWCVTYEVMIREVWRKYDWKQYWKQSNKILVMQTDESDERVKSLWSVHAFHRTYARIWSMRSNYRRISKKMETTWNILWSWS